MKRIHLFEIEDQDWCPRVLRDAATDYLRFVSFTTKPYAAIVPILASALQRAGKGQIVDLCSGAAGPWSWLQPALAVMGLPVSVCLTDKYPNLAVSEEFNRGTNQAIRYHPQSVDAAQVPRELTGFRTMFTAFHHFAPQEASAVLADAVRQGEGIAVFEATERSLLGLLLMLLAPLMVVVMTPFIRPFRWSRLLWTYLIPLVPMVLLVDAVVSCFRTYSLAELAELTEKIGTNDYQWEIGSRKNNRAPLRVTYLIGIPKP